MWFKRKPANRRFQTDHVLDVKLRSDRVRETRWRAATRGFAILTGTCLALFLLWRGSHWALDEFVFNNRAFAVKEISVQTDGVILPDQIRRWAGVKADDNLFALDLPRIKRDLELRTFIQSAAVERVLPHTLKLRITEREPAAQIWSYQVTAAGSVKNIRLVDGAGWVMELLPPPWTTDPKNQSYENLPILIGVSLTELQPGRRLESPQVQAALRLIAEFDHSPMVGVTELRSIDVSAPETLLATTGQGGKITFARAELDTQLRRWRAVHDAGLKIGRAIATLDLSVTNNIPARWADARALPPGTVKPLNPTRTRKKNV